MISIIICTFNRRYLLEKMLKSILAQNFDEYEIIIVNDCSNDDTLEYLSNFINYKNFKIINNKINLGLVSSRIIGIRYAKNRSSRTSSFKDSECNKSKVPKKQNSKV